MNYFKRSSLFFVLIIITLFVLTSCVTVKTEKKESTKQPPKESAETKDWKTVKSEDGKLSLKVPQDWRVKPAKELNLGAGKLFAAFGPEDGDYTTNLQVSKEAIEGATLSAYISQFEKNSRDDPSTKELKVIEEGKVNSDLGEAYRKKYAYTLATQGQTFNLIFDAYYQKKGDDYYVIQMVTTDKLYDSVKGIFNNILSTLNIKG